MEQIKADALLDLWKANQNSTIMVSVDGTKKTSPTHYAVALNDGGHAGDKGPAKFLEKYANGRNTVVVWNNGAEKKTFQLIGNIPQAQPEVTYTQPAAPMSDTNNLLLAEHLRKSRQEFDELWMKYKTLFDDYAKIKIQADTAEQQKELAVRMAEMNVRSEHKGLSGVEVQSLMSEVLQQGPAWIASFKGISNGQAQLSGGSEIINRINMILNEFTPQVQEHALVVLGYEALDPGNLAHMSAQIQQKNNNINPA